MLSACGFSKIVMSNIDTGTMALDAENIALPTLSIPWFLRTPFYTTVEALREPLVRWSVSPRNTFSFWNRMTPGHFACWCALVSSLSVSLTGAVATDEYVRGGLRNGPIPNYIYRWTSRDVEKSVRAYHPERSFDVMAYPYWILSERKWVATSQGVPRIFSLWRNGWGRAICFYCFISPNRSSIGLA